jgi:hypothetical protein
VRICIAVTLTPCLPDQRATLNAQEATFGLNESALAAAGDELAAAEEAEEVSSDDDDDDDSEMYQ